MRLGRRELIVGGGAVLLAPACLAANSAVPISLLDLLHHPMLAPYYAAEPPRFVAANGLGGFNATGAHAVLIEEQRSGAEWVVHGIVSGKPDYVARGWLALDLGAKWQEADGGWGRRGYFHSNALYLEGLARALIVDPGAANPARLDCLRRGCRWLIDPANAAKGSEQNAPYTHRRYILAATLGEAAQVLGEASYRNVAEDWARKGLALQQPSGENPELGGADASYQMVGVLFALRYYPIASDEMQAVLRDMIRRAINWELALIGPDGRIDIAGSTRIGHEAIGGKVKQPNYPEIFQALLYADGVMPTPKWREAARSIAGFYGKIPVPPAGT